MKFKNRIGIIVIVCLGTFLVSCHRESKFESNRWKESGGESITLDTRANMVNDLIESGILIKKNELEIAQLIGNPEKLRNEANTDKKHYPVQEKYGWDIDPEEMIFLEINYDEQGLSESVKLIITK